MAERVFNLPDLGEGLEDAEIVEWKVAEGDAVELNQPLVDVNTAKALVEIPSPYEGTVVTLHGGDGDVVEVGKPLVTFDVADDAAVDETVLRGASAEAATEEERPRREAVLVGYGVDQERKARRRRLRPPGGHPPSRPAAPPAPEPEARPALEPARGPSGSGKVRASPVVRRLAKEHGLELAAIRGSGPGGRIRRQDVEQALAGDGAAAAAQRAVAPGTEERVAVRGVRRLVARKMAAAWEEVPHVTTFRTVDATWVEAFRRELSDESDVKVSPLPIVVRALAEVCGRHPKLNATFDAEAAEIVFKGSCHVGIATDTEEGLMVPVIRDADRKGVVPIAREIRDVVSAARMGRATPDQLTGSTITVTNVGTFGSEFGTPIINVPEVAILALGTIQERPWVVDGELQPRKVVTLSLSFDHRIIDGAEAGRAMTDLAAVLESPFRLGALPRR